MTKMQFNSPKKYARFLSDQDGSATVTGIYFFLTAAIITGLAVDQANGWRIKTQLQAATDAAALAGAANLSTPELARTLAHNVAKMNLPTGEAIQLSDISLGHIDPATLEFVASENADGSFDAVQVDASRSSGRANAVPTFLLKLIGNTSLDVNAATVARAQLGLGGGELSGCEDAVFLSTKQIQTGGSNELHGAVCIHGAQGVSTGGGDLFNEEVRITAESLNDVFLASFGPSDLTEQEITAARTMEPVLLPQLDEMRDGIWDELWKSRGENADLWHQPIAPWGSPYGYWVGEYELAATDYEGILPDFVFNDAGIATVHMRDAYWGIQPDELEPNTIYLSDQGIQFSGGVDIEDIAIITQSDIGVGGGNKLFFDDVYFIGSNLNFSGSVDWGATTSPCNVEYGVYAFGTQSLSLGGWTSGSRVSGMVGAAPRFEPGGAMNGTGVYFESDSFLSLGGNMDITGCGETRQSDFELADLREQEDSGVSGSFLFR